MNLIWFGLGLLALISGAEALVRGASKLSVSFGISPLVVGLTVVAFGTSAPELVVSLRSAYAGHGEIAIGNVVGSNIFNLWFILGLSALIVPLAVDQQLVRQEVPIMIGISLLFWALAADGGIGRVDGVLFVLLLAGYTYLLIWQSQREPASIRTQCADSIGIPNNDGWDRHLSVQVLLILGGLALLVVGARWLVDAAVAFSRYLGVSELVVGLTIVAAGTSLPEVATSLLAAVRGQRDIAVGNVIGSNLFNILGVLGISAAIAPVELTVAPQLLAVDLPIMVVAALACLPIFFTGNLIARWEGVLFFAYYIGYIAYLVLLASQHEILSDYRVVIGFFVLPLTSVTLSILALRHWRAS
jgi:cation:H+ antiporter